MALNTTFYNVQTNIETLSHPTDEQGGYNGSGDIQHNPSDHYALNSQSEQSREEKFIRRSFIHAQTYKMDAGKLIHYYRDEVNQRMWGPKEGMMQKFGVDVEKQLWAETLYTACHLDKSFRAWENETSVCVEMGRIYKFLFD